MALTVDAVLGLLEEKGARRYGNEPVSQLEHALQCAAMAESEGAPATLVAAALLHDLGHLLAPDHGSETIHQYVALPFLRGLFPEAVLEPIRLHVDAKRYLCRLDPRYHERLSPASRASLASQGGPFSNVHAAAFEAQAWAGPALRLRRWDDRAKVKGLPTPSMDRYATMLRTIVVQ